MSETTTLASRLSTLTDEFLEALFDANPSAARYFGLPAWDGRLPDLGESGLRRRVEELDRFAARLDRIQEDGLSPAERVDLHVLRHECGRERFEIVAKRIWHRDPLRYLDELGVTGYLVRDYAPLRDRASGLCRHLEGVPRLLDAARENLDGPLDPTVLDTAIRAFESWATFVDEDLAAALEGADEGDAVLRRALVQARNGAAQEARRFAEFLVEKRRLAKPGTYAIGAELLTGMLRREEGVHVPLSRILELGRADLERNRDLLRETAARIDAASTPAEIMHRIKSDHPGAAEVLPFTRELMGELREFLVQRDIVSIPTDTECRVEKTPPYLSWSFAMMNGTPCLAEQEYPGIYYVTPPAADWDEQRTEEWLTEFSRAGLANTSVHEAWPGHFLHGLHIRRNPSRAVRISHAYSSAEAWAHYSEQLMVEEGFRGDDPELRMIQLGDALLRNVRLLVSIGLHTGGLSVDEAVWMFREDALLSEQAARTEAERGTFDPGYLNYTLGKLMLLKLREDVRKARGDDFSLRDFHDDFLYWGMAPVPIVREAMLGSGAGSPL
ncbi:MAG: hypothetical protein DHS20C21_22270 [Gemmatimonadota bacterium]|nr:MAG: hypothetical protein DHS20C21_22270 [Gemmatimonadota bacterium]